MAVKRVLLFLVHRACFVFRDADIFADLFVVFCSDASVGHSSAVCGVERNVDQDTVASVEQNDRATVDAAVSS